MPPARGGVGRLDQFLRALWSGPSSAVAIPPWRCAPQHSAEYVAVPSVKNPHLLLPRKPNFATATALRDYNTGASSKAQRRARLLAFAATLGLARLLPGRVVIVEDQNATRADSIRSYLSDVMGQDLILSVYLGPDRAVEKPVIQLITAEGKTVGFAKVGVNELTQKLVRREASNLASLADAIGTGEPAVFEAPTLVHSGTWNGLAVMVQTALPRGDGGSPPRQELEVALQQIARSHGTRDVLLHASTYWKTLQNRVGALGERPYISDLRRLMTLLEKIECRVTLGSWHGDFAPWNMTYIGSTLSIWDWEHIAVGVPVGFDAVHLPLQVAVVTQGIRPQVAFAEVRASLEEILAPFDLTR